VVEGHPATICYVKNQGLGFEVPWRDGATPRRYLPDFIVRLDDGHGPDDPLNLVVEIKGQKDATTQIKAETMPPSGNCFTSPRHARAIGC
jgi:type III restriction enzyme